MSVSPPDTLVLEGNRERFRGEASEVTNIKLSSLGVICSSAAPCLPLSCTGVEPQG